MQIPSAKLDEFIGLYQEHYGVILSREEALEKATKLLNFIKIIIGNNEQGE